MFSFENNEVERVVLNSVNSYEKHFKEDFPLQEYLDTDKGVVTTREATALKKLIDKSITENKPVETPKDFYDRLY